MSLLEKALSSPNKMIKEIKFSDDEVELVEAWFNSQVGIGQICSALGVKHANQAYVRIAFVARFMWQEANGRKGYKPKKK